MLISPSISSLRKMDGTRYKGNTVKAINGALSSTGIFHRLEVRLGFELDSKDGSWILNEKEFSLYEQRARKKIESKYKRKRGTFLSVSLSVVEEATEEKSKRKYSKRRDRKQAIISILNQISEIQRQANPERNSIYFENPFSVEIKGSSNG